MGRGTHEAEMCLFVCSTTGGDGARCIMSWHAAATYALLRCSTRSMHACTNKRVDTELPDLGGALVHWHVDAFKITCGGPAKAGFHAKQTPSSAQQCVPVCKRARTRSRRTGDERPLQDE